MSEAQDTNSREIFAFNNKVKVVLAKLQKEMQAFGGEAAAFSDFEKTAVIKSIDDQASFSAIKHSMSFKSGAEMVVYPPNENGDLLSPGGRLDVKPAGVVFDLFITDRPVAVASTWRKKISVGRKVVSIKYNLEHGTDLAPLSEKINKSIQEVITKELLP